MMLLLFALFRAGFEPLWWRRDHEPSVRIECRSVFQRYHSSPRGSKPARISGVKEPNLGRAEFFRPTVPRVPAPFRPHADTLSLLPALTGLFLLATMAHASPD
jgi:hypothetical protein